MEHKLKILMTEFVTHNVRKYIVEKPKNYKFVPGQATQISINKPKWKDQKRFFTYTSLNDDFVLQFIIKSYPEHKGVTNEFQRITPGEELLVGEPWGKMRFKGPGVFIAGGAGISPFIAILRQLRKENKLDGNSLILSNKTSKDIILETELKEMLGKNFTSVLTKENNKRIDEKFLKKKISDFSHHFYICGPPQMIGDIKIILMKLGAKESSIVIEGEG